MSLQYPKNRYEMNFCVHLLIPLKFKISRFFYKFLSVDPQFYVILRI